MKKLLVVFLIVFAGLSQCGSASALTTYIPHITGGEPNWTDYLQVNNNAPSAASFTLALYNNGTQVYSQVLSVGGLSRSLIDLKGLNPNAETGIITYTEPGLVFRVSYQSASGGLAEFKTIDALGTEIGLYFSDFTTFVQWKGLAVANMGTTSAQVTLYALGGSSQGSGGSVLGSQTVTVAPRDKAVGVHSAWFSSVPLSQIESIIAVTDSASICGIAICGDSALSRLLFTPAIPAVSFDPQASQWDVTCSVNLDGVFPVTADLVLSVNGVLYSAQVTTKKIAGADEVHVVTLSGPFSGSTGTVTNQVANITTPSGPETITLNGSFTINGNSLTASGTVRAQGSWGTSNGTFTATGTRK